MGPVHSSSESSLSKMALADADALAKAYEEVRNGKSETNWCLAKVIDGKVTLSGSGSGGEKELRAAMDDDHMQFGYVIFKHLANKDSVVISEKFILVTCIGKNVGGVAKAKMGPNKAALLQAWPLFSIEMQTEDGTGVEGFNDERLDNYMIRNVDANWMELKK